MALLSGLSSVILVPYASRDVNADLVKAKAKVLNLANGGPTELQIQNLSAQQDVLWGGDGAYLTVGSGNGEVSGSFNLLDFPLDAMADVLGYQTDAQGIIHHGSNTVPPYFAMYVMSHSAADNSVVWMGLPRVVFSRGDVNPKTNTNQSQTTTDQLSWRAMNRADGDIYLEGDSRKSITESDFQTALFGSLIISDPLANPNATPVA